MDHGLFTDLSRIHGLTVDYSKTYPCSHMENKPQISKTGKLLEEELTYRVRKCIFTVRNKYGSVFKETICHNALVEEFKQEKLSFISKPRIKIYSLDTGKLLGFYVPDFLVEGKVILEIKALAFMNKECEIQSIQYLKASEYEIVFLVNFGSKKLDIRRRIYTNDRKPFLTKFQKV